MLGLDPSISCRHTVALHFKHNACVSRSSGRALQNAHFFARGIRSTESKGFNTEKQTRTTETTEQKRIWALPAAGGGAPTRSAIILRGLRGPRLFLRVGILAFLIRPQSGRTPTSPTAD